MRCLLQIPERERISDIDLRRHLKVPAIESQIRRARMRYAASLIRVAQPSFAALLSVGRSAPADWARMLLVDLESLRSECPLFSNLGDPSVDWEHRRALLVTPVGDRAIRLSLSHETRWRESCCISTVDLSCALPAEPPTDVLLCPDCPRESVRVFTSEKARQAHRARAHEHRAMARDFIKGESCPACCKTFGSHSMANEHLQCWAQRCRRMMLDGLLPKLAPEVVRAADEDDRTAGLTKCKKARFG